jgi:hypothetical protein
VNNSRASSLFAEMETQSRQSEENAMFVEWEGYGSLYECMTDIPHKIQTE